MDIIEEIVKYLDCHDIEEFLLHEHLCFEYIEYNWPNCMGIANVDQHLFNFTKYVQESRTVESIFTANIYTFKLKYA